MEKYKKGKLLKGVVTGIEHYGVFVQFDDYYTGLIHISQINGKFIDNINDYFKIGETIKVRIIDVDEEKKQLKLSTVNIKKNKKLPETILGFELFEEILPEWIDEKLDEIEKNK